jgi:F-type H+-transporting ATPase subunit b
VRRALAAFATALARAGPALGSEGAHGGESDLWQDLIWPALNFALLVGVLLAVARRPIRDFFRARGEQIRSELDAASRSLAEAEARHADWQRRLTSLDAELARIRADARERAEAERAHILSDAAAAAERIRTDARNAVDQELRRAREQLRREAAELAVELAAEALRTRVTDDDRGRLVDEFIQTIERSAGTAPGRGA